MARLVKRSLLFLVICAVFRFCRQEVCDLSEERVCTNGDCVSVEDLCDYYDDCYDNTDERNCSFPPADTGTALVYTTGSPAVSVLWKLFGNLDDYVYKLNDSSYSKSLPIHINYIWSAQENYFGAVAVDYDTSTVYFSNGLNNTIETGQLLYQSQFVYRTLADAAAHMLVTVTPNEVKGLAFDWLSKNLYWTNGRLILVSKFVNSTAIYTKTLVTLRSASVKDIAVDPLHRYLFWYDSLSSGVIIRADLAGSNAHSLSTMSQATKMVADSTTQTLYFLDTVRGRLASMHYDGTMYTLLGVILGRGSLAVHSSYIFLGDTQESVIYIHQKQTGNLIANFTTFASGPVVDITVFSRYTQQTGPSPCTSNNGNCSHLCVTTSSTTRDCHCDDGYTLSVDGRTCVRAVGCDPRAERVCASGACLPISEKCDYYDDCLDNGDEENCGYPTADNRTALVYVTGNANVSVLWKLFGNPDDYVYKLSNSTFNNSLPIHINYIWRTPGNYFGSVAVDYETSSVYFWKGVDRTLCSGALLYDPLVDYIVKTSVALSPKQVKGMAFDWVSKNLYWTNGNSILVTKFANSTAIYNKTLVSPSTTISIQDLAVDAMQRYLFWFDSATPGVINRADLLGSNTRSLSTMSPATKMVADGTTQTLYFLDSASGRLASMSYDGTAYSLLGTFPRHGSLAVHSSYIFLGDSHQSVIDVVLKGTATIVSSFRTFSAGPVVDMTMFSRDNQQTVISPCTSNNGNCSQLCVTTSSTTRDCHCDDGYTLSVDGRTCVRDAGCDAGTERACDSRACLLIGEMCDYYDDCLDNGDEQNCAYPTADNRTALVYVTGNANVSVLWKLFGNPDDYVYKLSNSTFNNSLPIHINYIWQTQRNYFGSVAVDYDTSTVYYGNMANGTSIESGPFIYQQPDANYTSRVSLAPARREVKGMTFDWLSRNLYWTNGTSILVTKITGRNTGYTKTIVPPSSDSSYQDIALDAQLRYLFWLDSSTPRVIMRADLVDQSRNALNLKMTATRLAADCATQTLYFLDTVSGQLGSIRYDGSSFASLGTFAGSASLAVYSSYIFLGDARRSVISIHRKDTGKFLSSFSTYSAGPVTDMTMFARQQSRTSPCLSNNGDCQQLCMTTSSRTRVCQCADGYALAADDVSCIAVSSGICRADCGSFGLVAVVSLLLALSIYRN